MEILEDIYKKQNSLLTDIQHIKKELSELKIKNDHLEKVLNEGNKRPINLNSEKISDSIWNKLLPLVKTENTVPKEIQEASNQAFNKFNYGINAGIEQLNNSILKIPRYVKFDSWFYGFTDRKTFYWTSGIFVFVILFCSAIFLFYYDTIKIAENEIEQNQIMRERIDNFREKNPSLGEKYFPLKQKF